MAIRKYRKKMNGGSDVANKFWKGALDVKSGAERLNEKRKIAQEEAKISAKNVQDSYNIAIRSGSTGGTALSAPMNNLSIPPSMHPPPPHLGGKRNKKRTRKKRGLGKDIDWSQVDYDSWADEELGKEYGSIINTGRGNMEVHKPKSKSKLTSKPKRKLTIKRSKNSRKLIGGKRKRRRKTRRRRKRTRRHTRRRRRR